MYHTSNTSNYYKPETSWICCTTYKDRSYFQNVMEHIELSSAQKQIIQSRYLHILENFQKRTRNHSIIYFIGHFIVTVGSLFVPALLSVQNSGSNYTFNITNFTVQIYWATFIISLMVTVCNGILALFKIDKKYYFLNTTLERLRSEGWQYFGLTGRYSGHLIGNRIPTHQNQFIFFIHYIEKIKMKQVEEEYYKSDEKTAQAPPGSHAPTQGSPLELYARSPERPISAMGQIPEPVKNAVNSIIKSQKTMNKLFINGQGNEIENEIGNKIENEIENEIVETIASPKPSKYNPTDEFIYHLQQVDSSKKIALTEKKEDQNTTDKESSESQILSTNILYTSPDFTTESNPIVHLPSLKNINVE